MEAEDTIQRVESPRDETEIVVEGNKINREELDPIIPDNKPSSPLKRKKKVSTDKSKKKAPAQKRIYVLPLPNFHVMSINQRYLALVSYKKKLLNIRSSFPSLNIPLVPETAEPTPEVLEKLHTQYDGYMTHILVSEDVSQSMVILILVLGAIELILTKALGLPGSNYIMRQIGIMGKYRALLYEIGEEKILSGGGKSSPLARLCYLILTTAIITVGVRLFESTFGKSNTDMIENLAYQFIGGGFDKPSPEQGSGVDLNGLFQMASTMFGGNINKTQPSAPETRGPTYDE